MAKRSIWKAKFEKVSGALSAALAENEFQAGKLACLRNQLAGKTAEIAGLADALRATAEQLEVRGIYDTARHIRAIADNYSPARLATKGEELRR